MSRFRSAPRTIVTEIKAFVVDSVSRSGVFRQSVSARVADSETLSRQDVNITSTDFYEIKDVSSVAAIMAPEPIRVELIQTVSSHAPEEPEAPPEPPKFDVSPDMFIGDDLFIRLRDDSLATLGSVIVSAMSLTSGETEDVKLNRVEAGVFEGFLATQLSQAKGKNFDGVMNVSNGSRINLRYAKNGVPLDFEVDVTSPYEDSAITSVQKLFPGRPLPIVVEDVDLAGLPDVMVDVLNTTTGQSMSIKLLAFEDGVFQGLLDTTETVEPDKMGVVHGQKLSITFTSDLYADTPTVEILVDVIEPQYVPVTLDADDDIPIGESIVVILDDYNRAGVGALDIAVSNTRTREYVMVRCEETLPYSGIFHGELDTRPGSSLSGVLGVSVGDVIEAAYVDTSAAIAERLETATLVLTNTASADLVTMDLEDEPVEEQTENVVDFLVDGLFFFNGAFTGTLRVYGLSKELTRCSILHS